MNFIKPSGEGRRSLGTAAGLLLCVLIAVVSLSLFLREYHDIYDSRREQLAEAEPPSAFTPVSGVVGQWELSVDAIEYPEAAPVGEDPARPAAEASRYCRVLFSVKNLDSIPRLFLDPADGDLSLLVIWNQQEYAPLWEGSSTDVSVAPLDVENGFVLFELPDAMLLSEARPALVLQGRTDRLVCGLPRPEA